ncbi:MAG: hypothetical protein ACOC83_07780, partial [Gemmatimonadota bacterium]
EVEVHGSVRVYDDAAELEAQARRHELPVARVGEVGRPNGVFRVRCGKRGLDLPVARLAETYETALPRRMEAEAGLTS